MIEYVIPQNPDDRVLAKASDLLKNGELVCFPTDTNWLVTCSPYNKNAVEKLYKLKEENIHKHFSVMCSSISMASEVAHIEDQAFKILKKITPGHYTFIFKPSKKITKVLKASKTDKEIGLRFTPNVLARKIIDHHGDILLSTNITPSILNIGEDDEIYSYMIEEKLSHLIPMIIDPGELEFVGPSTIVDFSKDEGPELIRAGAGPVDIFGF